MTCNQIKYWQGSNGRFSRFNSTIKTFFKIKYLLCFVRRLVDIVGIVG